MRDSQMVTVADTSISTREAYSSGATVDIGTTSQWIKRGTWHIALQVLRPRHDGMDLYMTQASAPTTTHKHEA